MNIAQHDTAVALLEKFREMVRVSRSAVEQRVNTGG